jgi:hypothetical protein
MSVLRGGADARPPIAIQDVALRYGEAPQLDESLLNEVLDGLDRGHSTTAFAAIAALDGKTHKLGDFARQLRIVVAYRLLRTLDRRLDLGAIKVDLAPVTLGYALDARATITAARRLYSRVVHEPAPPLLS